MVKNPPAMQETWVWPLGWENPLEDGMGTHSSILAWRILMDRGAWPAAVHRVTKSQTLLSDWAHTHTHTDTHTHTHTHTQASISPVTNLGLKCQTVWELVFLVQAFWLGWLMWGLDPFLLKDNLWNCGYPPFCGLLPWGCGYWLYCISVSPFLLAVVAFLCL